MRPTIKSLYGRVSAIRAAPDMVLVGAVLLLAVLGQIMVYSTTFYWSYTSYGSPFTIFLGQLRWFALGIIGFVAFAWIDYGLFRRWAVPVLVLVFSSLLLIVFIGSRVFGAQRSLFDGSVQPSEFAKLGMVLYAAAWLAGRRTELRTFSEGMLPYGVVIGIIIGLVLMQPDLSTAFVLSVVMLTMYFMSEASISQFVTVLLTFAILFALMINFNQHSSERLATFLASLNDPLTAENYHIRQLMLTMAGGGWLGHGIGASYQKFAYLPTPHTDSVIAVLVDETGIFGLIFFLGLIGVFVWRGIRIAMAAKSSFGAYIAVGITVWVAVQTMMNLFSVLAMIPFTGVPVPFLSLGGSSLVSLLLACGVLVSISRGSNVDVRTADADDDDAGIREPKTARRIQRNGQFAFLASHDLSRWNRGTRASSTERAQSAWGKVRARAERVRRELRKRTSRGTVRR